MTLIAIATAGPVDGEVIAVAGACLVDELGVQTRRLAPLPDIDYAWDASRRQYSSTLVLRDALTRRPPEASRLLVLTECDIFIPMLSFVFGQAQLGGPVAIVSLARLHQEFYGLSPSRTILLTRTCKEALHEVGHTLGLTHCPDTRCTMSLATSIQQLDAKGSGYCSNCRSLLREVIPPPDGEPPAELEVSREEALGDSGRRR